jgi:mycothiol S-conjugate amidase
MVRRALLTVHAHPDDEASKGAPTCAKYAAQGVHTVLVCATGGEEGDILNPAMDRPEIVENLHEVRRNELAASADAIGFAVVEELGYRDSGMEGSEANENPACFHQADFDEAVGRLVAIIRREKPQVIITYPDDQGGYRHPDHLRVHDITLPAFEKAGDADAYPELGEPFSPSKLYYSMWSRRRLELAHAKYEELGLESPYTEDWFKRPSQDDRLTTKIDVTGYMEVRDKALLAHATQVDPESKFWFGLPPEVAHTVYPYEDFVLARSTVGEPGESIEDDLFAGIAGNAE